MKYSHLIFAAFLLFAIGCAPSTQLPNKEKPKKYPTLIEVSTPRQTLAAQEWRRLLETYGAPSVPADFYPVTFTPRSLQGIEGGIKIMTTAIQPNSEEVTIREAARKFIDRWRDLLNLDPANLSLSSSKNLGGVYGLTYQQSSYPFPIAGGYGEMVLRITSDGRLTQLDDRFIPVVELPVKPVIDRAAVAQRVANRAFTYSNIAGQPQTVKLNADEIAVKELVIFPVEKGNTIAVHLAWEITAGKSFSWNVYIDAIDGTELGVVQKFNT